MSIPENALRSELLIRRTLTRALLALTVGLSIPAGASAQAGAVDQDLVASDTYLDPVARQLHQAASANWAALDESVRRYTARVQQRIAAMIRAPLKDRILYRNESAARVFWDRDHDTFVQVLGANAQYPGKEYSEVESFLEDLTIDEAFDPGGDRLIFGFGDRGDSDDPDVEEWGNPDDNDFWVAHPLAGSADSLYQYQSGDTLTLTLPDGRQLTTVELMVIPRELSVHLISGALWIDAETGALVRGIYRLSDQFDAMRDVPDVAEEEEEGNFDLVPGIFKPWTFDLQMVAVEYALWDFKVWLPRSMRIEGRASAGILKFPIEMDIAYRIENVVLEDDIGTEAYAQSVLEERHFDTRAEAMAFLAELMSQEDGVPYQTLGSDGRGGSGSNRRFLVPEDRDRIANSPHLPPPIWEDAPGFASADELAQMVGELADIPLPQVQGIPWAANWGLQRPDLVRYNRVEGLAIGARFQARFGSFMGPITFQSTGFIGTSDLDPKVRLGFDRSSVRRRWELGLYREIRAFDPRGRYLELGNSLNAMLFGRDDGEYFKATGVDLKLTPPESERQSWILRGWAERQDPLGVNTSVALTHLFDSKWRFRPNMAADRIEEAGGELSLMPWWGTDPLLPQFGLEIRAMGAAWRPVGADDEVRDYARLRTVLRSAIPLVSGRWRIGLEAGAGTSWGDLPAQRNFLLGGSATLRGYTASVLSGTSYGRGRLEVARVFPASTLSFFGDGGWAGDRDLFDADDILYSVGVGGSILDGLIRMDISRGLRGPFKRTRFDLYLDAIL